MRASLPRENDNPRAGSLGLAVSFGNTPRDRLSPGGLGLGVGMIPPTATGDGNGSATVGAVVRIVRPSNGNWGAPCDRAVDGIAGVRTPVKLNAPPTTSSFGPEKTTACA